MSNEKKLKSAVDVRAFGKDTPAFLNDSSKTQTSSRVTAQDSLPARSASVGDLVSNGAFSYVVTDVEFAKTVRNSSITETASGEFIMIDMVFVNRDANPRLCDRALIRLFDDSNVEYLCCGPASDILAMSGKKPLCAKTCPANGKLEGILVFDVPSSKGTYRLRVSNGGWNEKTRDISLDL